MMPSSRFLAAVLFGGTLLAGSGAPELFAQVFTDITPASGPMPAARRSASAIYDPMTHRMVVFGGQGSPSALSDVWAFDLAMNTWTELAPNGAGPGPRFEADVVYDRANHAMIVYQGQGPTGFLNDAWSFDLVMNTWTELMPPDPKPAVRYGSAAIYDPVRGELVSYAGFTNQGRFGDVWRLAIDQPQWTEQMIPVPTPDRRCLHVADYDPANRRMLTYGGQRFGALGDLWELDLDTFTWNELTPAIRPEARFFPSMVWDTIAERLVLFGGQTNTARSDETWVWWSRAGIWEQLQPDGDSTPSARQEATAIFVPTENRMILFGGSTGALVNEVWSLDLTVDSLAARAGNVNAGAGGIANVVLVNGSPGSMPERRVNVSMSEAFLLQVGAPPSELGAVPFALYAFRGMPTDATARPLPFIGSIGMPIAYFQNQSPSADVIWNSLGGAGIIGAPTRVSVLAPATLATLPSGIGRIGSFYFQGLIQDSGALRKGVSVTNGVWVVSQ